MEVWSIIPLTVQYFPAAPKLSFCVLFLIAFLWPSRSQGLWLWYSLSLGIGEKDFPV